MNDQAVEEFLEHYGVKGMKWGKSGGTARIKDGGGGTAKIKSKGKVTFKPTAKGDLARASVGGVIFAPKSTSRTAKRAVAGVKGKVKLTPANKAKRAQRKKVGKQYIKGSS
jgi:hypothetical protein